MAVRRSSNNSTLVVVLLLLVVLGVAAWWMTRQTPGPVMAQGEQNAFCFGGVPRAMDASATFVLLVNKAYVEGYSDARHDPIFAAYHLTGVATHASDARPPFAVDNRTASHVTPEEYTRSGYDRGHMVPNHVIDAYFGPDAQLETFFMSNVVPQRATLNRDVWEKIEAREANDLEPKFGEMWVFVGPIFGDSPATIGQGVQVPEACFRIWIRNDAGTAHAEAFICPNEGLNGHERPAQFLSTVKDVEMRTHLDFFEALDPGQKQRLETEKTAMW